MRVVERAMRFIDIANRWVAKPGRFVILLIMVLGSIEVMRRNLFSAPTLWTWDLNGMLLCVYVALGGGYTLLLDQHLRMDIFYARFSPRIKAIVDVVLSFLFFAFTCALLWYLGKQAAISILQKEHTVTAWEPPIYHLRVLIAVGCLLVLLQGIATFIRNFNSIFRQKGTAL